MASVRPTVVEVRTALRALLRVDARAAAGADGVLQANEAARLLPFTKQVASALGPGDHSVKEVVDAAVSRAALGWGAVNQPSGPGKAWLSQVELARLTRTDASLGAVTVAAHALAFRHRNPAPMSIALDGPAGLAIATTGVRVVTVSLSAAPTVPHGTRFDLIVDGQPVALSRGPAGFDVDRVRVPHGYGLEVISRGNATDETATAVIKIARDSLNWLTHDALVRHARNGLEQIIRSSRSNDADWQRTFPSSWAELELRGVPAQLDAFLVHPDTDIIRAFDSVSFVGQNGPFGLYTEVEVAKADGAVKNVLIEID